MSAALSDPFVSWCSQLLSGAHGLAAVVFADGRVQQANEAATRMCGADCAGMVLDDLFDADGVRRLRELVAGGSTATLELGVKPAGGRQRAFLFVALPSGGVLVTPSDARAPAERPSRIRVTGKRSSAEPEVDDEVEPENAPYASIAASDAMSELPSN